MTTNLHETHAQPGAGIACALVLAMASFMTNDVWTVHHAYHVEMLYPNGVQLIMDNTFPNGIRFEGTKGWVFCARGSV